LFLSFLSREKKEKDKTGTGLKSIDGGEYAQQSSER